MKNSADQGGCYSQRPKAEVDNTLRNLQNSSYLTKAEFNNCFIIHSKYSPVLKGVSSFRSLFFCSPKITQSRSQVFSVNGSIIFRGLHFWRHFDVIVILFTDNSKAQRNCHKFVNKRTLRGFSLSITEQTVGSVANQGTVFVKKYQYWTAGGT